MEEITELNFNLQSNDIWGDITDDDIINTIATIEAELSAADVPPAVKQAPATSHTQALPAANPAVPESKRFASKTEDELAKLEQDRHEKKTMDATAWAVRLMKGDI